MKNFAVLVLVAAMVCATAQAAIDPSNCKFSIYKVDSRHRTVGTEIIAPLDVVLVKRYRSVVPGEIAWQVQLTPSGGAAIKKYTSQNVGGKIAVLCNGKAVSEAFIQAPFGSPFVFTTNGMP